MIGYIRVFKDCYATCETKEEGERYDLRITEPFEELMEIVESFDLAAMDKSEHKLVPFIVILIQELKKWQESVRF